MTAVVEAIETAAEVWLPRVWAASWQGGVAALLAWCLSVALRDGAPALRCWLRRGVCVRFVQVLVWPGATIALPLLGAPVATAHATEVSAVNGPAWGGSVVEVAFVPSCLLSLWLAGVLFSLTELCRQWCAGRALYLRSRPCEREDVRRVARRLGRRIGLQRIPELRCVTRGTRTPLLTGIWRPSIVIPSEVLESCSPVELRALLGHELAHAKRRDLAWNLLPALTRTLFFFHPLVWLAQRRHTTEQEIACDEHAVHAAHVPVRDYASFLLSTSVAAEPAPSWSSQPLSGRSVCELRHRLRAMAAIVQTRRGARIALAVAIACLLVPVRVSAQESPVDWTATERAGAPREVPGTSLFVNRKGTIIQVRTGRGEPARVHVEVVRRAEGGEPTHHDLARLSELAAFDREAYELLLECVPTTRTGV